MVTPLAFNINLSQIIATSVYWAKEKKGVNLTKKEMNLAIPFLTPDKFYSIRKVYKLKCSLMQYS